MTAQDLTILIIDDDPADVELLRRYLEEVPEFAIELLTCTDLETGRAELTHPAVEVILIDYHLGPATGLDILKALRRAGDQRPIIVLTGQGSERLAVEMLHAGANDYLVKGDLNAHTLNRSLRFVLERFAREQRRTQVEEELMRLARFDELTGLCNRRYLMERLTAEVLRSRRYKTPLCLLMLDLDHFKRINDTYGHLVGDTVLSTAAGLIHASVRATDIAGRYGGEEFCVVLTETPLQGAYVLAERLRQRLAAEAFPAANGTTFHLSCSIGLAPFGPEVADLMDLLERADKALYTAKTSGRNRTVCAAPEPDGSRPVPNLQVALSQDGS